MASEETFSTADRDTLTPKAPKGWGARHTTVVLGFWAMCILYALRFNLSMAIVDMVGDENARTAHPRSKPSRLKSDYAPYSNNVSKVTYPRTSCEHLKFEDRIVKNATSSHGYFKRWLEDESRRQREKNEENIRKKKAGRFDWSREEQGIILGSFFWGHVFTQIPGGLLAQRYGAKWPVGLGILFTSLLALITPLAAHISVRALITVRVLQGLVGGVVWPAMHLLLGKWAPPDERSKLVSIVYAGPQFGTAIVTIACGYLIDAKVMGGWPSAFYVIGGVSLVWFIFWVWLMHNTPASHPRISPQELVYIERSLGQQCSENKGPTPWKSIFTSLPLWAILIAHVGEDYGLYTLLTELPTYMQTVLHFDVRANSWMSAIPHLVRWLFSIAITYLADYLIHKRVLRVVTVRKLCNTIGHWGSAIALVGVSYLGCDPVTTVTVLTLAVGISGAVNGGCITNHVDIAPSHAGILMGITNTAANVCGIVAPFIAGLLTNEEATIESWRGVFFIAAGVYALHNLFYIAFASGSEQPWNRSPEDPASVAVNSNNGENSLTVENSETLDIAYVRPKDDSRRGEVRSWLNTNNESFELVSELKP